MTPGKWERNHGHGWYDDPSKMSLPWRRWVEHTTVRSGHYEYGTDEQVATSYLKETFDVDQH